MNYKLNGKVNHCLNLHKRCLVMDAETKRGYKYIGYILFLRNEVKALSEMKRTKDRILLIQEARDILNQVCERYLLMHGVI